MMETGRLVRWNSSKGFGFIEPDEGGKDVFIHISTLKHMARKPIKGDQIEYIVAQQTDGKIKASQAQIVGVATKADSHAHQNSTRNNSGKKTSPIKMQKATTASGTMSRIVIILIVIAIGRFAIQAYHDVTNAPSQSSQVQPATIDNKTLDSPRASTQFSCEAGKTHCSHMQSCEEAIFYINHCPDTQMDGNGDGVPCERQFCN
ncbi:cold shock domain-containing protein [Shewanella sp. UCD-KL21]|uniref:cold shock domain-containing protein n=1 Tax=Shewanella sp. UCD-KL21 TaxID=1917164 RepID=UPI0026DD4918|nr:cold shock domain-containing protein [Shewanella sp. UCD-KL21]